eukprot:COSAG05_NODE_9220_length_638_cov_1.276438_1_plen_41_part_01
MIGKFVLPSRSLVAMETNLAVVAAHHRLSVRVAAAAAAAAA